MTQVTAITPNTIYMYEQTNIPTRVEDTYTSSLASPDSLVYSRNYQSSIDQEIQLRLQNLDNSISKLENMLMTPTALKSSIGSVNVQSYSSSVVQNPVSTPQTYMSPPKSITVNNTSTVNTPKISVNVSEEEIKWALDLEDKVNKLNYKPSQSEIDKYNNIAQRLVQAQNEIAKQTGKPTLPTIQYSNPQEQIKVDPNSVKQVTLPEVEWALRIEEKVKKGYKPTQEEIEKYQDILTRYKANPKVKVGIFTMLAAQSASVGAQVSSIKYSAPLSENLKNFSSGGVGAGIKSVGGTLLKGTGLSALVSGGFSAVTNLLAVIKGEKTKADGISSVVSDTVGGAVSGLGATLASGVAMSALTAAGVAGFPLTLLVGGVGLLGAYLADKLFQKSGAKDWIKEKIEGLFNKK